MPSIEVILSPILYTHRTTEGEHIVVAVDILRATTAICAAFKAGVADILPLSSPDTLPDLAAKGYTTAAEYLGLKLQGATFGNSPTEYLRHDLHNIHLAYSTTNGTRCILTAAHEASLVLVGAFANISALSSRLLSLNKNVVVLCSGWRSEASLEDSLFAGALIQSLADQFSPLNDAATIALTLWHSACQDPQQFASQGTHYQRLLKHGMSDDLHFAFLQDSCPLVPHLIFNTPQEAPVLVAD